MTKPALQSRSRSMVLSKSVQDCAEAPISIRARMRGARLVVVVLTMGVVIGPAGCARTDRPRIGAPRTPETVFSPLHLPTPNTIRTQAGLPGRDYWQQRADYTIEATLDDEANTLRGRETITYTNNSPDSLPFVWLYLEQNLYKRGAIGSVSGVAIERHNTPENLTDGCVVESVRVNGRDASISVFDTVGRIELAEPLAPTGGKCQIEIAWSFRVPKFGDARMGWETVQDGIIYQFGQWFPAMCVYDDVFGWNTLPYLGEGEFYSNFGDYDVSLTVPRRHLVAATGVLQNPLDVLTTTQIARLEQARGGTKTVMIRGADEVAAADARPAGTGPLTWRFSARDVRTFAWASSAAFIWDAAAVAERGKSPREAAGEFSLPGGTLVQSFYPKEALPLWAGATDMLRFSIEHYNQHWFAYPYPSATNVNSAVPGMEYPMVIYCSERKDERELYGVTTHEIGHNWFPMVVNTDERRFAWMDEGFNSFINCYSMKARKAEWFKPQDGVGSLVRDQVHAYQPTAIWPDQLGDGALGLLEYDKVAVAMYALRERVLGPQRFDDAFRRYIRAWAFKSPQPADFYRCMENAAGCDLAWFWRSWFVEAGTLDQAIVSVEQRGEHTIATFDNLGEMVMPIDYRVTFTDGSTELRQAPVQVWYSNDRCEVLIETGGKRVRGLEIDPDGLLPDVDRSNNRWGH